MLGWQRLAVSWRSYLLRPIQIEYSRCTEFTVTSELFRWGKVQPIEGPNSSNPSSPTASHASTQPDDHAPLTITLWKDETHPVPVRIDEGANIHRVPFGWDIKVDIVGNPVSVTADLLRRSRGSHADDGYPFARLLKLFV